LLATSASFAGWAHCAARTGPFDQRGLYDASQNHPVLSTKRAGNRRRPIALEVDRAGKREHRAAPETIAHIPMGAITAAARCMETVDRFRISPLEWVSMILVVVGALNWGLVGLFEFDLVAAIFGRLSVISRIVYVLVAVAGVYLLVTVSTRASGRSRLGGV
jgi:uncharacterized protein